jgi:hypothetical protein
MELMDTMDIVLPYFGHNGRYNTLWTPSPLDGVQEVGGSNPYRDDEDDIILSANLLPLQSSELFRTAILKVSSNGEIVREIKRI